MVGRKYDQRVLQTDLFVDVFEKGGQGPVEPQQIVLRFETGRSEHVSDVIGG